MPKRGFLQSYIFALLLCTVYNSTLTLLYSAPLFHPIQARITVSSSSLWTRTRDIISHAGTEYSIYVVHSKRSKQSIPLLQQPRSNASLKGQTERWNKRERVPFWLLHNNLAVPFSQI